MVFLPIIFVVFIIIFWLAGWIFSSDFSVTSKQIRNFKNVLLIFPHADDEVLQTGGIDRILSAQGSLVTLLILTKGEKGTPDGHLDLSLKNIRASEAKNVAKMLSISELMQEDFGDGVLTNKREEVKKYIEKGVAQINPDLVITYDLAGLYGHEDHIVVSEIVTELIIKHYKETTLWYVSFPKRILSMATLPEHMAKDPEFKKKRVFPNVKVFIGLNFIQKIKAVYTYKSQYQSFRDSVPFPFIPLWFFYSMWWWEYFYEVK